MKQFSMIFAIVFLISLYVYQVRFAPAKDIATTDDVRIEDQEGMEEFLRLLSECNTLSEAACDTRGDCAILYDEETGDIFEGCTISPEFNGSIPELE